MNGDGTDPRLVTAQFASVYVHAMTGVTLTEACIRQWATRGHIARYGRGPRGRTLYDLSEILAQMNVRSMEK